jgi:hypothetical protein
MELNEDNIDFMAKVAESAANQTKEGIIDMLKFLAKRSLQDPNIPNHVANTLVATIGTIKKVDVADFFTPDNE